MNSLRTRIRTALTSAATRHLASVEFCDSCSQVCDTACRAHAQRNRLRESALTVGFRL